ncbi:MAG: NUDIX hydrolase [Roseiflexaceae bacterium]|nr:NUDIX hydrolase [Roseiflexaceae bacterium]
MLWKGRIVTDLASPTKRVAAGALFFNPSGELLIVKPSYQPGWLIPGGAVELRESPLAGCRREVLEEIGLRRPLIRLLCVDYRPASARRSESLHFLFAGGALDEAEVAAIMLPLDELTEHQFLPSAQALALLRSRLRRRVEHGLRALRAGDTRYLENGKLWTTS